jgi:putative ABC transport system substrate-binding protein
MAVQIAVRILIAMTRHVVGWLVAMMVLTAPALSAGAASPRIGILMSQNDSPYQETVLGFRQALEAAGVSADIGMYSLEGDVARARDAVRQELEHKPALLFAVGLLAVEAVKREAPAVPMVAGMILSAAELRGASHATGVVLELPLKTELEWLRRVLPDQKNVGLLYSPSMVEARIREAGQLADGFGLKLHVRRVEGPRDLPAELDSMVRHIGVLWGLTDPVVLNPQTAQAVLLFSFRNRIPMVGLSRSWVQAGALYALGRDFPDIGAQCAEQGLKILRGVPITRIPVVPPRTTGIVLNLRTARHMKIELSPTLIRDAVEIIE